MQRTLTIGGRITVWLVSSLTRLELTNERNIILFVFSEAVKCNLVKLETSRTVILPPMASVLWFGSCQTNRRRPALLQYFTLCNKIALSEYRNQEVLSSI